MTFSSAEGMDDFSRLSVRREEKRNMFPATKPAVTITAQVISNDSTIEFLIPKLRTFDDAISSNVRKLTKTECLNIHAPTALFSKASTFKS